MSKQKPLTDEPVILKQAPICFCGTPLIYYLVKWEIGTFL